MTHATQQQPEPRPFDANKLAWARVANNAVNGLFYLAVFALILRACGRI